MPQRSVIINASDDAKIVMYINELDGTVAETVLWGPGAEQAMRNAVKAAVRERRAADGEPGASSVDIGRIEVDDDITATVADETLDAAEICERIVAFLGGAIKNLVAATPANNNTGS
jgi:hypothetical protein